jgi:hypothetical protein
MMGRRIAVVGTLLIALLGAPRPSEAGLLEIIWEMSGPQMLGFALGCLYSPSTKKFEQCRIGENPTAQYMSAKADTDRPKTFIGFSGGIYGSTGVDSGTQEYKWWEIGMVELGTGLSFRSFDPTDNHVRVQHGFGVVYERLFGRGIENFNNGAIHPFNKFAFTVTPVDVTINDKVAFGIKLRLYPHGFTDDQLKAGLTPATDRPFETTVGFTFSIILKKP